MTYSNSSLKHKYEGSFEHDVFSGVGTLEWKSGAVYAGSFKGGLRDGQGSLTWSSGDKYVGEWKEDLRDGKGMYTWKNGGNFEGEWRKGKRHGLGAMCFAQDSNELVYTGHFADDEISGVKFIRSPFRPKTFWAFLILIFDELFMLKLWTNSKLIVYKNNPAIMDIFCLNGT
jgi:hypothetical protein